MSGPPEDAYGRVTNPERYAPVLEAARALVDDLVRGFDVDVITGRDADPVLQHRVPRITIEDAVRLVPQNDGAAGITVAFTAFPGVFLRAGEWWTGAYPHCGCDACDEDPANLIDELRRDVDALTAGRLSEGWDGSRYRTAISFADGSSASGWSLVERDRDLFGEPREFEGRPWRSAHA